MPKRITAKMLADLAGQKRGCGTVVITADKGYWYVFVYVAPPRGHWKSSGVYFWLVDYDSMEAAKRAAYNFLMERPDKEGG